MRQVVHRKTHIWAQNVPKYYFSLKMASKWRGIPTKPDINWKLQRWPTCHYNFCTEKSKFRAIATHNSPFSGLKSHFSIKMITEWHKNLAKSWNNGNIQTCLMSHYHFSAGISKFQDIGPPKQPDTIVDSA